MNPPDNADYERVTLLLRRVRDALLDAICIVPQDHADFAEIRKTLYAVVDVLDGGDGRDWDAEPMLHDSYTGAEEA